ncbi:MAG: superfamily II DNA or RNA helicase [Granulosicoccus sp.]|jgi:superfamily II DNA or RNA helicase
MQNSEVESVVENVGKKLYGYQKRALETIFNKIIDKKEGFNLLYQLPTGGGKTVIFAEITRRFIEETGKKVLILTHRIELCAQTSNMLSEFGVKNKIINSKVKELPDQKDFTCFVAMVETLNNRLQDEEFEINDIGLVIIDEAHYNSFRKLFKYFEQGIILGVTATPLSSNIRLPMNENYDELIVGESISTLIEQEFLARAETYGYNVSLKSLKIGINGDYTVGSSEKLYSDYPMQEKLLYAYEENCKGKKTLIFNNGIKTSKNVLLTFEEAGYEIKHLDNTNTAKERKDILHWFKTKPDAILTSVSILTTGFDEPTVESIILNRATKSLTLYFQMIGRGSRVTKTKSRFVVIDLGNNASRFGYWEEGIDWQRIFLFPEHYYESLLTDEEIERHLKYVMPREVRERFANSESIKFDMRKHYDTAIKTGKRPKFALDLSLDQHHTMCLENSKDHSEAIDLIELLQGQIEDRLRQYSYCICKSTPNYIKWLVEDYSRKLRVSLSDKYE